MKLPTSIRRAVPAAAIVASMVLASPFAPGRAEAYAGCRSDPVVALSNLGVLDLNASIGTGVSQVQKVVYAVHAPAGTFPLAIINTDSLIGLKESVQFYADQPANTYVVNTTVYTGTSRVSVTAGSTVVSLLNVVLGSGAVSGLSDNTLQVRFKSLLW